MKKYIVLLSLIAGSSNLIAQDPIFFNTNQSLVYLNPSFAGSNGGIRNQFSFRRQWPQYSNNYTTALNTFDFYVKGMRGGFALSALSDNFANGTLITRTYGLGYAQQLKFFDKKLTLVPSFQCA